MMPPLPSAKAGIVIPTFNPGRFAAPLATSLQPLVAAGLPLLVIDSGSSDADLLPFRHIGAEIVRIDQSDFDHGGTRQRGVELLNEAEFIVFLTQDALPVDPLAIGRLLSVFSDPSVALAYGRQLPHADAGPFGSFARSFNYPSKSVVRSKEDTPRYGIKTAFVSNSFAAYRRSALSAVGGFPCGTIFGEDTIVAARMLLSGWKVAYVAEAVVFHSHDYSLHEEFRRYFDVGVLHAREPWLRQAFGEAEGEGGRYVRQEFAYLRKRAPWLLLAAAVRNALKYLGYRLGRKETLLPRWLKQQLSMNRRYWLRQAVKM